MDGDSGNCVGVGCEDPVLNFLVGGPLAPDEEEVDEEGESLLFGSQSSSLLKEINEGKEKNTGEDKYKKIHVNTYLY